MRRGCVADSPGMNRLILGLCAAAICACGGSQPTNRAQPAPAVFGAYTATRWIPANASYALTGRTVRDVQQNARDLIDTIGVVGGVTTADISRELSRLLRVDPLSADAVAQIGVDLDGGFALFSESINPTLVVRLASAPQFEAFVERQQLRVQSVVDVGVEVFTAALDDNVRISWAIADGWLWLHLALPGVPDDSATWFRSSREPGAPAWVAELVYAKGTGEPPVVGFADVARFLAAASAEAPALGRCASALGAASIGRLAITLGGDRKQAGARFALDVGAAADGIAAAALPVPEGWQTVTAQVPLAVQWNLDLAAARAKADPCLRILGVDAREFDELGVRAGRGFIRTFDPDEREGTGAVALDLSHKSFFAGQLDQIPLRSTLERKRTFGPYAGKSISIPMFLTIDYVLTDQLALAAVGDGLLVQLVARGGTTPGPLAGVAVQPAGLSVEAWAELLALADVPRARTVAQQLQSWRDVRVNLTIEGSRLVLTAAGVREPGARRAR